MSRPNLLHIVGYALCFGASHFIAVPNVGACPPAAPPQGPNTPGHGWWQDQNAGCTWVEKPCEPLPEFLAATRLLRLPAGCPVSVPGIYYPREISETRNEDLRRAAVDLPQLRDELNRCRRYADKQIQECQARNTALINDQRDATRRIKECAEDLKAAEKSTVELWWARWGTAVAGMGGVVMGAAGTVIYYEVIQ